MDLILYIIIFLSIGFYKMKYGKQVESLVHNPGEETEVESSSSVSGLHVGNNLKMLKEKDAYMLIVEQFGLR